MSSAPTQLRFRDDGSFTIVQLTDTHWHNGEPDDLRTRAMIERILDQEQPDLVALTGDIVGGYDSQDPELAYRSLVAPIEARKLPWAAVLGNHDDEGSLSRLDLVAVIQSCPMSLTEGGPTLVTGVGNYVLEIARADGAGAAAALYFLDSGSYNDLGVGHYAWIGRDQIAWYVAQSQRLAAAHAASRPASAPEKLPALAFFHIPLPEYDEVWDTQPCRGFKYEPACPPSVNSGFFAAMVERGDVMGTFAGHDHINDYEGELYGIRLCYGRGSGHSCYGQDGFQRGARVIRLRQDQRGFDTWVRQDDGSVVDDPPLHQPQGRVLTPGA